MASAMTTIRVGRAARDRLAALAAAHERSIGAELEALLDDLAWKAIEAGYQALADRGELAGYRAEAEAWTANGLDELEAGADAEYPEYNPTDQ